MSIAIISDIHGNLEAFRAVLSDIRQRGISRIWCLGDVVGYGPRPAECLELAQKHCEVILLGNHEDAVLNEPIGFYALARSAIEWTRKRLFSTWYAPWRVFRYKKMLDSFPRRWSVDSCLLVHGSPRNPTTEYIFPREFVLLPPLLLEELFLFQDAICFAGHTHVPAVFSASGRLYSTGEDGQEFSLGDERLIINVGSVGQPRDHDPRSCYVEYRRDTIVYHRVSYAVEVTQQQIMKAGLNAKLAERLAYGM